MIHAALLATIVALLPVASNGLCEFATLLPLSDRNWTIGSDEVYDFVEEQRCMWILPTINFLHDILLLHIYPFDFRYNNKCLGDVALDDMRLCSSSQLECMLFTDDLTNIDFSYIQSQMEYEESLCATWRIETRRLRKIYLRTFDAVGNLSFKIQYQFIKPGGDAYTATRKDDEESDRIAVTERKLDRIDPVCTNCTGYIIALAVTSVCLLTTLVILAKCSHMRSLLAGKRQPRVRGSFFQTESIDDEVDEKTLRSPVPSSTPKSPDRKGNTSCFFQTLEDNRESDGSPNNSDYVNAKPTETQRPTVVPPNFYVDQNGGEPYYDTPRSAPVYAKVKKNTKATE